VQLWFNEQPDTSPSAGGVDVNGIEWWQEDGDIDIINCRELYLKLLENVNPNPWWAILLAPRATLKTS
jgi:hypothetical protein